ncbi:DUF4255 domain-containing protein [Mucilaginibacter sp. RS28]|uniref:DUF4255 domain-containing protein n=1 Tax=Mucilaginibacter straminoryzae TaxID=2932774 RepID=A0A9X2B7A1_9SPHI|nr:DUF4255 domain-containing protein [Mucilaginibacter straminoryzae]MCJ8208319.1 DUF4255 domain-containing protein [Mucilaginibacter straminoryzae]
MIFEAINYLAEEMNEYFRSKLKVNEDKVIISALVNQDGTIAIQGENKLVITLVNLEREINGFGHTPATSGGQSFNRSSPATINLHLMFSAYFSNINYTEALRFLSFVVAYFQSNPVFGRSNAAGLDPRIEKLTMEMVTLSTEQVNNIWSMLGAKYMPSVIYKMRMLIFDDSIVREVRPVISGVAQQTT